MTTEVAEGANYGRPAISFNSPFAAWPRYGGDILRLLVSSLEAIRSSPEGRSKAWWPRFGAGVESAKSLAGCRHTGNHTDMSAIRRVP